VWHLFLLLHVVTIFLLLWGAQSQTRIADNKDNKPRETWEEQTERESRKKGRQLHSLFLWDAGEGSAENFFLISRNTF
jgi:hypothetical protein